MQLSTIDRNIITNLLHKNLRPLWHLALGDWQDIAWQRYANSSYGINDMPLAQNRDVMSMILLVILRDKVTTKLADQCQRNVTSLSAITKGDDFRVKEGSPNQAHVPALLKGGASTTTMFDNIFLAYKHVIEEYILNVSFNSL